MILIRGKKSYGFSKISLELTPAEITSLKQRYAKLVHFIEKGGRLNPGVLNDLQKQMSTILQRHDEMTAVLKEINSGVEFYQVNTCNSIIRIPKAISCF